MDKPVIEIIFLGIHFLLVLGIAFFGYMVTKTEKEIRRFEKERYERLKKDREERRLKKKVNHG